MTEEVDVHAFIAGLFGVLVLAAVITRWAMARYARRAGG